MPAHLQASFRVYPRFVNLKRAASFSFSPRGGWGGRFVSLRTLRVFTQAHPGATLIIATPCGFKTHQTCLKLGWGGELIGVSRAS